MARGMLDFHMLFLRYYSLCFLAIAICSLSTLTHALLLARRLYQQGVLHVRFLRVAMACVFDPLLPGVFLHAFCHTLLLDPIVSFLLLFIYVFLEFLNYHTLTLALSYMYIYIYIVRSNVKTYQPTL